MRYGANKNPRRMRRSACVAGFVAAWTALRFSFFVLFPVFGPCLNGHRRGLMAEKISQSNIANRCDIATKGFQSTRPLEHDRYQQLFRLQRIRQRHWQSVLPQPFEQTPIAPPWSTRLLWWEGKMMLAVFVSRPRWQLWDCLLQRTSPLHSRCL